MTTAPVQPTSQALVCIVLYVAISYVKAHFPTRDDEFICTRPRPPVCPVICTAGSVASTHH